MASGDQNPIVYIALNFAIRTFIALLYATAMPPEPTANVLGWLSIFVLGAIPGLDPSINFILFLLFDGTLALYLVLLLKRIANPLAN